MRWLILCIIISLHFRNADELCKIDDQDVKTFTHKDLIGMFMKRHSTIKLVKLMGNNPIASSYDCDWSHILIFTLANNFLRWTHFGPTRFIHPWTTLVHATLRVSDVIEKCNSLLADVTFDWHHLMVTAVERNNQTRRIVTFLRRLFARFKSKFHK